MNFDCYVINKHCHAVELIDLFDPTQIIPILPLETVTIHRRSNFHLYCQICQIGNYPGTSHSVVPDIYFKDSASGSGGPGGPNGPKYYCIVDFSIQETHWMCPCFSCDPAYLEMVPAGNESRAISIFVD